MAAATINLTASDVGRYVRAQITKARRQGGEWRAPCPIHKGTRDSFAVNTETGEWFCHSQCGRGGSLADLEMELSGCDFGTAVERITGRPSGGIPDMRFINRRIPIGDVAHSLDLRFDGATRVHCWHPERHKNSDRTASVGLAGSTNTAKCFSCDTKPLSVVDLVVDVLRVTVAEAAKWIGQRFPVPTIPARKHLAKPLPVVRDIEHQGALELLVKSGVWAVLPAAARSLVPVFHVMAPDDRARQRGYSVTLAYRTLRRLAGLGSDSSVSKGLEALDEIGFLKNPKGKGPKALIRATNTYRVTPFSESLLERAHAVHAQTRAEIEAEREMREDQRRQRADSHRKAVGQRTCTKYKTLSKKWSDGQSDAPKSEASTGNRATNPRRRSTRDRLPLRQLERETEEPGRKRPKAAEGANAPDLGPGVPEPGPPQTSEESLCLGCKGHGFVCRSEADGPLYAWCTCPAVPRAKAKYGEGHVERLNEWLEGLAREGAPA